MENSQATGKLKQEISLMNKDCTKTDKPFRGSRHMNNLICIHITPH